MTRFLLRRWLRPLAAQATCLALTALSIAQAQGAASVRSAASWSWATIRSAPNVDTARVAWLEQHLSGNDARTLFELIDRLSKPEAAQLLAERMYGDGSVASDRALADSLFRRPSPGTAGAVDVAYHTTRLRETVLARARAGRAFATEFTGDKLIVPNAPHSAPRLTLHFDFAPAETLLAIVTTANISAAEATRRISTPMFDPLIQHRSQSFYPVAWSRELMGLNLARAASTDPIDRLYIYAQPRGFLQYGDVNANRDRYRAILRALHENERAMLSYVADTLSTFLPEGADVKRTVSIYFAGGADGWATSAATAFDLEYFKDDYRRLLNVIVHETYHAAQNAIGTTSRARTRLATSADSAMNQVFTTLFLEGTANYIAPAGVRSADEVASAAREGERLVSSVYEAITSATPNRAAAQQALNAGVASGGPFYWLGASMAKAIVDAFGRAALANTLRGTGPDFLAEYVRATKARPESPRFFTPEIIALGLRLRD